MLGTAYQPRNHPTSHPRASGSSTISSNRQSPEIRHLDTLVLCWFAKQNNVHPEVSQKTFLTKNARTTRDSPPESNAFFGKESSAFATGILGNRSTWPPERSHWDELQLNVNLWTKSLSSWFPRSAEKKLVSRSKGIDLTKIQTTRKRETLSEKQRSIGQILPIPTVIFFVVYQLPTKLHAVEISMIWGSCIHGQNTGRTWPSIGVPSRSPTVDRTFSEGPGPPPEMGLLGSQKFVCWNMF